MISVAMLSKWHVHAADYARQAKEIPDLQISLVWDEIPERGEAWAKELGVPFVSDLSEALSYPGIDAVIVDAPTNIHKEVMVQAALHKKHIFTEKVLALTSAECEEIFAAVDQAGVTLMLSLPRLTDPTYVYAQDALDRGWLGKLNMVRCRLAHNGAIPFEGNPHGWLPKHFYDPVQCGGGALVDLGAHPIYLTNRLAGPAKAVTARFTHFLNGPVDDNSVAVVEYASGAMGIVEAGFVSGGSPFLLELHGTEGSVIIQEGEIRIRSQHVNDNQWTVVTDRPAPLPSPMRQWVNQMVRGEAPTIRRDDMLWLTKINETAALSNKETRRIEIKA